MTDVLASPVDVDRVGSWERLARAPGPLFLSASVAAVLVTWGAASWPGFWLPLALPLEITWLALIGAWLGRLALAPLGGRWQAPRWLSAPAIALAGVLVVLSGLPLMTRLAVTSGSLSHDVGAERALSDSGRLRHQCAHGRCLDTYVQQRQGSSDRSVADLGIYLNVRNSVRAQALVWHPGGKPAYVPCGIRGFEHVYGPWYLALTSHQFCAT